MYQKHIPITSAKEAAIRLLSRRDHGVYELRQKLTYKGYELADVEQAIDFCIEHNFLDDLRFARSQVRQHVYKGHGERRIRQELSQKRVDESLVDEAIFEEDIDWYELAKTTAHKQFKGKRAKDNKEYAKQVRFMQYRGYTFDQISYAIESFGSEFHQE